MNGNSLVLTIRAEIYSHGFSFRVGKQNISVESVQTEVDAGYEGKKQVVLIEAKNSKTNNDNKATFFILSDNGRTIHKNFVVFLKKKRFYSLWQFDFNDINDYNSIKLSKSQKFEIIEK